MNPVIVGISGASGSMLARKTIDLLLEYRVPVILVCSNDAKLVWKQEMPDDFADVLSAWQEDPNFDIYSIHEMTAPIASGTFPTSGMVVVPCSMSSAASISLGISNNLLLRSADVCLKERRTLILVPRETPIHATHLENLTRLARLGAVIMPPDPPFYLGLTSMSEVADFFAHRVLISLDISDSLPDRFRYLGNRR